MKIPNYELDLDWDLTKLIRSCSLFVVTNHAGFGDSSRFERYNKLNLTNSE